MPKHNSVTNTPNIPSKKNSSIDALLMLKQDHRTVETLFDQFLTGENGKKPRIAEQIFHELEVHSTLEEELFYPTLQNPSGIEGGNGFNGEHPMDASEFEETGEMIEERGEESDDSEEIINNMIMAAYDEHRVIRGLIAQLRQKDALSDEFRQGMMELQQTVANHVFHEEDELFAEAQLTMDTKALGTQIQQRKQALLSAAV